MSLKQFEAGALLLAGVAFGWWQLRDVKRAQAESARRRNQAEQDETIGAVTAVNPAPDPAPDPAQKP